MTPVTPVVPDAVPLDWDFTYLLGWYDANGRDYLSSWMGNLPPVEVVVIGHNKSIGPPLWNAPVPPLCKVYRMPSHITDIKAKIDYASHLGGVYAFGWILDKAVDRTPKHV